MTMSGRSQSVKWLVNAATTCKAFTEPALSVLYYSPPVLGPGHIRMLTSLLQDISDQSTLPYRNKIKFIEIYFVGLWPLRSKFSEVAHLASHCPQLKGIQLGMQSVDPKRNDHYRPWPSRYFHEAIPNIVQRLQEANIALEEWNWNYSLDELCLDFPIVRSLQMTAPLTGLVSVTFSNAMFAEVKYHVKDEERDALALADALESLPLLKRLQFYYSDFVPTALKVVEQELESLTVISCANVKAQDVEDFIIRKGHSLEDLILKHNKQLNLAFLSDLSDACPSLRTLDIDLLYFNSYWTCSDASPEYSSLLDPSSPPTWPESLQRIELLHLRKWDLNAAETFFSSLAEHGPRLKRLRHLKIKASLDDAGWRDRSTFRGKWVTKLEEIFSRKMTSNEHEKELAGTKVAKQQTPARKPTVRRASQRLNYTETSSDDESPAEAKNQNARQTTRGTREKGSNAQKPTAGSNNLVQGECDVVEIAIDNLRPMEDQLRESDFLDEELSGDGDWNERDGDID